MQLQSKKNTLAVLLVGWLIVLGSYLIIRFVFILIGFTLNPTILGICLAVIPCLLETLYLGKCGKSQRISVYVLGLLIPSIVEKVALYLIGAFLCGIDPANIAGVMEAAAADDRSGTEDASASYIGAVAEKCTDLAQPGLVIAGAADDDIFTVGLQV